VIMRISKTEFVSQKLEARMKTLYPRIVTVERATLICNLQPQPSTTCKSPRNGIAVHFGLLFSS
jgi:hypothetical protein